ncbi:MAG TPA: hypothetical protein VFW23_18610 [Tepidisphaeraceae bacterium]|nr:hypothetical protein [Tepidisphaeraceae bacterium]
MNPAARPSSRSASPFRELRRWTVLFVALVVGLLAMRYGWNALTDRRIAELERQAHAMGQPLLLSDFKPEVISDADNAAVPIGQAWAMYLAGQSARGRLIPSFTSDEDSPIAQADLPAIAGWINPYQTERNLIRSARARPQMVWNRPLISPVYQQLLPQVSASYSISEILLIAAEDAYARSDDGEGIEDIRDLLLLQKAIDGYYPVLVAHMVGLGIGGRATIAVRRSAMNLRIVEDPKAGATRNQIAALIADLLDERSLQETGTRAFFGEAAMFLDAAPYEARRLHPAATWLFEPMYKSDAESTAAINISNAQAFGQPHWPAVHAGLKSKLHRDGSLLESFVHPMFRGVSYDPDRWPKLHFQHLAERRVAAVMLALRLYQRDHGDAFPQSLTDLVPQYLLAIPADPFDPAGKPPRYLPLHDPPILYSVGENGTDDGGSEKPMPGKKMTSFLATNRWQEKDAVFSLKPVPRLLQAQDHQGQVNGGKGQKAEK